jgi:hypothetical protein
MNVRDAWQAEARGPRGSRLLWGTLVALALALGVGLLALGAGVYSSAHVAHPVEIDGEIANYKEVVIEGGYARNELSLAGDTHVYVLDRRQFHPDLPQRFYQDARIRIWIDQGTTQVIAVTLYDLLGVNAVTYTTDAYDDPTSPVTQAELQGVIAGGAGVAILVIVPLWLMAGRRRRRGTWQQPQIPPSAALPMAPLRSPAPTPAASARRGSAPDLEELPTRPAPALPASAQANSAPPWSAFPPPSSGQQPPTSGGLQWNPARPDVADLPTQETPSMPRVTDLPTQETPSMPRDPKRTAY